MELPILPRPEIFALPRGIHGSPDYQELESLGLDPAEIIDFSVNSNPYGPSPRVIQSLAQTPLDRYPDRHALPLRRSLADHLRVDLDRIVVANGTPELLWMIALAYLCPADKVLIVEPTFGEYGRVSLMMGASIDTWVAPEDQGFALDLDEISAKISQSSYRLVFLCNPNNPTGQVISVEVIAAWVQKHPLTLFVLDEAYFSFSTAANSSLNLGFPNLIVLRSMTKDFGLAALRLGYAVAENRLVEHLVKIRPPYSVSALAQVAGIASLEDQSYQ